MLHGALDHRPCFVRAATDRVLPLRGPWTGALAPDASTLFRQSLCALRIAPLDLKHGYFGRYFRDRNDLLDVVPVIAKFKVWPILAALFVLMHISEAHSSGIQRCPGAYGGTVWHDCIGIYTFLNGTQYMGKFRNNKFHGWGLLVSPHRGTCVGFSNKGKIVAKKCLPKPHAGSPSSPRIQERLRNKPIPLKLIGYPPDLGINIPNLLNMSLGPSSVFRVRRCDPRFAFRGPWSGGLAPMHPAPVASGDDGVLARGAFTGFCVAPLARPTGPEPRATARVDEFFAVN